MKENKKNEKIEKDVVVWDFVDWDLDFETFEWFLHLCEVNNRHLDEGNQWTVWPDWPADMLEDTEVEHRQAWLNLLQFIHENEQISVGQNLLRVEGDHGTVFFLEFLGVDIGWSNISLSENPPHSVVKILFEKYENHHFCKWVPDHLQSLCLEPNSSGIIPSSLNTILMMLIHEVNIWDLATNYHWAICKWCGDTSFVSGRKFPSNVIHTVVCVSCGNDAPLTN
jgi:hypothetical protein